MIQNYIQTILIVSSMTLAWTVFIALTIGAFQIKSAINQIKEHLQGSTVPAQENQAI